MQNQKGNISVIVSFIIVVGLIGLVIYSLMNQPVKVNPLEGITNGEVNNNSEVSTPTAPKEEPVTTPTKVMDPNVKVLKNYSPITSVSKLEKIDVVTGSGEVVKPGATVSVHYTGAVAATGVIFQSSKDFGPTPVTFPLANVIKGWTDGIPGMKVGGTRRLIIPAAEAYGATPPPGSGIPANAALVFDVELVSISK